MKPCSQPIKPLILVVSCAADRDNGRQRAVELTWMDRWGWMIDHKILLGQGNSPRGYATLWELIVDAPDDYAGVVLKYQQARQWALDHGYTHVFHACVDTWINVPRLLASGFEKHDYSGYRCDEGHGSGGMGYWCSDKALRILLAEPVAAGPYEDLWAGMVLGRAGIKLHEDRRYSSPANPNRPKEEITLHLSKHQTGEYEPEWMREYHDQYLETGHV